MKAPGTLWRACAVVLLAVALGVPAIAEAPQSGFTPAELRRVLEHGPWPLQPPPDPDNPLSGNRFAAAFGQRLFFDSMLSSNGYVACASCHQPDRAWTDLIARAQAIGPSMRNTPTLANLRLQRRFGWAGATDSLWKASRRPLLNIDEMNSTPRLVARRIGLNEDIACRYDRLFGPVRDVDDPAILVNISYAIASFLETLRTGPTPFDAFRDALARGDWSDANRYPVAARRGLRLFVGEAGCANCHSGPNFSDGAFHATGVALGIPGAPRDAGRGAGMFRTPSLRNVGVTAPYLHDGSIDTLPGVLRRYSALAEASARSPASRPAATPVLTEAQIADLSAFLNTLTDERGAARTPPDPGLPCR